MPSITSWIRLEPRSRDDEMTEAVQARVYDAAWMLARQWQTAEFQGEDTGSPVVARWRADSASLTRYYAGAIKANTHISAPRYDARTMPLEALVERQSFRATPTEESLRLAAESGMHFLRMLDAQPTSRSYRGDFISRFSLQAPTDAQRPGLDAETWSYWNLMALRVPDARRLLAAFVDAQGRRIALPAALNVADSDKAEVENVINAWLQEHSALFAHPDADTAGAWNPERLEYAFSVAGAPADQDTALTAAQYADGHLDWYSVDLDQEVNLGAAQDHAGKSLVRAVMPAPVSFRGAPAQRFWEIEDAAIDYGLLPAGPGDIPHLMLSDFATNFGTDWYVIPIELDIGSLTVTRSLVITDTFGVQTLVSPVNDPAQPNTGWSMFELSMLQRGAAPARPRSNLLFLAPSLLRTLDSRALEEVLFMRDEMANIAWAVEHVVQGPIEQRIELGVAADAPQASLPTPGGQPDYRLATDVPSNWTPLLPQRTATNPPSLRLVRGAMLAPDGSNVRREARGELLNASARLALFDEEIPREGVRVTRQFERTRWIDGTTLLWIGVRKQVGKGEGSSALRFDNAEGT
jgi:hypothetical protein